MPRNNNHNRNRPAPPVVDVSDTDDQPEATQPETDEPTNLEYPRLLYSEPIERLATRQDYGTLSVTNDADRNAALESGKWYDTE